MGFRLTAKLPLSVTKPNCQRSLKTLIQHHEMYFLSTIDKPCCIVFKKQVLNATQKNQPFLKFTGKRG